MSDFIDYNEFDELDNEIEPRSKPTMEQTLDKLRVGNQDRSDPDIYYGLSDIHSDDVPAFTEVWHGLDAPYRRRIIRDMLELSEVSFEMNYRTVALIGLEDDDPSVRETSIELLWEDESVEVMDQLIAMSLNDSVVQVRAAAVNGLGRYILLGEYEDIPEEAANRATNVALGFWEDVNEAVEVRRRALEAIANSGHARVPAAIREAYNSPDNRLRVSSIFAMGRTCDAQWQEIVLSELESEDAELRYEASRAAGELELIEAVPLLARLVLEEDREIINTAIWSLGEIGGKEALRVLEALSDKAEDEEDDDLVEVIEDAIGNAVLLGDGIADTWLE